MPKLRSVCASTVAAVLALVPAGGRAAGQNVRVVEPRVGMEEHAGVRTRVVLELPAGLSVASHVVTGQALVVQLDVLRADGVAYYANQPVAIASGDAAYSAASGARFVVDLAQVPGLFNLLAAPESAGLRFRVRTAGGAAGWNVAPTSASEPADEVLRKDTQAPRMLIAIVQASGSAIDFVFSEAMSNGSVVNDLNQTSAPSLGAGDVQFRAGAGGPFGAFPVTLSNPRFRDSARRIVRYDCTPALTSVARGAQARPAHTPAPAHALYDLVGNRATADAAPVYLRKSCVQHDLNADGVVGSQDLALLLVDWGATELGARSDFDLNGLVDARELAEMLASWGACP